MMKIKRNRFVCTKYSLIRLKRILRFRSISAFSEKMREKIRRAKAVNIEWDFVCVANAKQEEYIKAHTLHQILFLSIFGINAFFCKLMIFPFGVVEFLNSSAANAQKE